MTTPSPITDEARKAARELWNNNWLDFENIKHAAGEIQSLLDSTTAELRAQLIYESHENEIPSFQQGGTQHPEMQEVVTAERCEGLVNKINELRAQVEDLSTKLGIEPTAPKTWNTMFDELVSLRAQVETLTKERDATEAFAADMLAKSNDALKQLATVTAEHDSLALRLTQQTEYADDLAAQLRVANAENNHLFRLPQP